MKILLFGANGQLGWELQRSCPSHITLIPCDYPEVDFLSSESIKNCIKKNKPLFIINAAAYTNVDKAEEEEKLADRINHKAVMEIASICYTEKIKLIHISTDFVFNGQNYRPYLPKDIPDPISVYGETKLKGEQAVLEELRNSAAIIRTAWLYSSHGSNFVKSMLKLMNTKSELNIPELNIIDEQIGTPTWANGLARIIWDAIDHKLTGVHHYSDAGIASWYDFAIAIQEEALNLHLIKNEIPVNPIPVSKYPTPARRPFFSVLDKTSLWQALNIKPIHWRRQLRSMLKEFKGTLF